MKKQKGFTLIELIIVIIILGILAAFAVPKFVDFSTEANKAAVAGLGGSIHAAATMVRGIAIARGDAAGTNTNIGSEDINLAANSRYPATTADGINDARADTSGFTFNNGLYTKDGAANTAGCRVLYTVTGDTYTVTVTNNSC